MKPVPNADSGGSTDTYSTTINFWETPEAVQHVGNRAAVKVLEKIADLVADEIVATISPQYITDVAATVKESLALQFASSGADGGGSEVGEDLDAEEGLETDESSDAEEKVSHVEESPEADKSFKSEKSFDADENLDVEETLEADASFDADETLEADRTFGDEAFQPDQYTSPATPPDSSPNRAPLGRKRENPGRCCDDEPTLPNNKAKAMGKAEVRRNPKRKPTETEPSREPVLPEKPLEEALRPLTDEEKAEWKGWAEVESEPAMFNAILGKLGVQDVRARELFSCDHWGLHDLPKPVLGMVFLFQYAPHLEDDEDDDGDPELDNVWFANQTTSNSCASVALLNIVMNADNVDFGPELREFKASTEGLDSAHRGHRIGSNGFIRAAHNSFARRMDQLNADLYLANEAAAAKPRVYKKRATRATKQQQHALAEQVDYGYHFIAYVYAAGFVWELDGMRSKPRKVGPCDEPSIWTFVAGPRIQERIQQYGTGQNAFSLLAICQQPEKDLRASMASTLAEMNSVRAVMDGNKAFAERAAKVDEANGFAAEINLSEFQLSQRDIDNAAVSGSFKAQLSEPNADVDITTKVYESLVGKLSTTMFSYRQENAARQEEAQIVERHTRDYSQGMHLWLSKLAEKGVLEQLAEESRK
ncbi:Ubiquitinyl hydrolase 1 [Purpureocillium takamizusanense]|uniref:Ubiquitin carboxyl-terminal hydrolase n=1 Tax=Purpureocillium takamizusanense TaxID=2060973 RepID=A0A9Q8QD08_9HYPO|nr:Ubiquitinyl hydrolase 1 [Purpureocillium takamizusanense]UNI17385.1 Ubiquitinyl hydrolase 1 [Purpureocillium takamizusanense]